MAKSHVVLLFGQQEGFGVVSLCRSTKTLRNYRHDAETAKNISGIIVPEGARSVSCEIVPLRHDLGLGRPSGFRWLAFKEFCLTYSNLETISFGIYPCYGKLK